MMKTLLRMRSQLAFAFFMLLAPLANAQTPVEKYGQLQIKNGKVSDENGNPVVLRGMSLFWSGYPEGSPYYNATTVKWLRDDWCVDVVRAAMSVETGNTNYINNASTEYNKVKAVIDACIANGLYVIVDFHTHNAPDYLNQAKTFFTQIANEYGNLPNILYEPYNEPIWQDWSSQIKPYHNEIISTIRAIDANNIIICGTKNYSQDVDIAANDPVTGTNVAYTLHYYANSHRNSLRQKAVNAMSKGAALFVTEYGTCNASGNGGFNASESQVWWDFLEDNQISSCNWSVSNKAETASILNSWVSSLSNWSSGDLTQSGALVKSYLDSKCNLVVTTGSVTLSFAGNQTQYEAGETVTINATTTVSNGSVDNVKFYSGDDLLGTDNSSPYSFSTSSLASGGHDITARSFDASGNLIAVSPLYVINVVGASNVTTTGISDQFESSDQFVELTGGVTGTSCASATEAAAAGIFWFEDTDPGTAFEATYTRAGDGTLAYTVSQAANSYNVIGFNFGEYCDGNSKTKYTLDLTGDAVLNMTVTAPASNTETLDLKFQMKDVNGTVLAIKNTVLKTDGTVDGATWYQHEIGYSKNHSAPDYVSLTPGTTSNFVYDFKDALTVNNPNNPSFPDDINDNNDDFDFSQVAEIIIIPVNAVDNGAPSYEPLAFDDQEIIFSGLTLGDPSLGENICTTPPAVSTTDVTYCQGELNPDPLEASGIDAFTKLWYTSSTGGTGSETAPIPSTSTDGVTTFYASQAVTDNMSCEGLRTALDVTIVAAPEADAGADLVSESGPSVDLSGTGSATGTWALESSPAGVSSVTFTPSANSANVTANGLVELGEYIFSYTVSGTSPCTTTSDEVSVNVSTITSDEQQLADMGVQIFPNPVADNLYVDITNIDGQKTVRLVDLAGRVVYTAENRNVMTIDMTGMTEGMYFVQIQTGSNTYVKSIVK